MRGSLYYTRQEYLLRAAWAIAEICFRLTPRLCYGIRRWLLRGFGADIGSKASIYPSARITFPWLLSVGERSTIAWGVRIYNLGRVSIGGRVVISQGAHLCAGTHDYETVDFPLVKKEITVEDDVWIAADAFIGPGVTVGRGAVVGARAVVVADVPAYAVMAGNPARVVKMRDYRGPTL
jgi:putative colanic acid biosynthesis acetyltransferase WcaF